MNMVNDNHFGKIHNVIEQYLEGRNRGLERQDDWWGQE